MISAEAEEIASSPRFLALADLVASGSDLSPEVISEIVTYLETKASTLNWFLRATSEPPVTRLTELLELGHTVDFEYATDLPITVDQRTYDYWLQKLPEKRRRERRRGAILDASAIALLNATNKRLKATNQRVCLITRAQSMFEVHAEEAEKERWQELWPILRHPRAFAAIRHLPATSTEELARQAEKIAKSIELVLDDGSGENNDESRQEMESEIEQLSETWRSLSRLAVSSQWNPLISHEVSEDMVRFQRFFDATQNSEAIRDRVEARRRKLLDKTEKSLWLHAFLIKEQSVRKGLRENSVRATRSDGRTTISCRYASVPFQIEFFSPDLTSLELLFPEDKPMPAWDQFTTFVKTELFKNATYEIHLLLAYLMGVVGQWYSAERFCRLALTANTDRKYEAKYFLAVTNRKLAHSQPRFQESMRLLDEATAERAADIGPADDPRYRVERAVQIFYWREHAHSETAPPLALAIDLTTAVINDPSTRADLRLQASANLLDFLIGKNESLDAATTSTVRGHLHRLRPEIESNERVAVSPYIIEAFAWADFVVNRARMSTDQIARLVAVFDELEHRDEFTSDELAWIKQHGSSIRRFRESEGATH